MSAPEVDPVPLEIESLDLEGRGVARRDGKVVFVAGALPGERALVRVLRSRPSYEVAAGVAILRSSAARCAPPCPHFGFEREACGGCSMQHLEPRAQLAVKQRALEDTLWHIGRLRPELILRPIAGSSLRYRHRARLSVRDVVRKGVVLVGFHERASSHVAEMRSCAVLPARVSALIVPLRELVAALTIRRRLPQVELAVGAGDDIVLVFRVLDPPGEADRQALRRFGAEHRVCVWLQPKGPDSAYPLDRDDAGDLALELPEFDVRLPFGPTDFTQVNPGINEILVRVAVRLLAPEPASRVLDFYCGLGNFTLPLARRAALVAGYEGSPALVARARAAAERHGLQDRTRFAAGDLDRWDEAAWGAAQADIGPIDRVLVDPPREGALAIARVLARVAAPPRRLVYVSCNPATLARDCAVLAHEGGWALRAAGVVNMFPHTSHVESIALLEPGGTVVRDTLASCLE